MTGPQVQPAPDPGQLAIYSRNEADSASLTVRGELDVASAAALKRELHHAEESSVPRCIALDLAALDFIDSTGIHQ